MGSLVRERGYLAALSATTLAIANNLDPSALLREIIVRAGQLAGTADGFLYVLQDSGRLKVVAGTGFFAASIGRELAAGEGMGGRVLASGRLLTVADYGTWEGRAPGFDGLHAVIGVPLKDGERTIGVIGLSHRDPSRTFNAEEEDLVERFSQLASVALQNATLYSAAQARLAELTEAEEALRKARDYAEDLISSANVIALALDANGVVGSINPALETLSGYRRDEVVGRPWGDFVELVLPQSYPEVRRALNGLNPTMMPHSFETPLLTREGEERHVSWRFNALNREGRTTIVCFGIDITERKRSEAELTQHVADLQALYDLNSQIGHAASSQQIYEYALATLRGLLGTDRAAMHVLESDGTVRSFVTYVGLSARYRRELRGVSPWPYDVVDPPAITLPDVMNAAAVRRLPAYLRQRLTEVLPSLQREGIAALGFIPIFKTRLLGFLSVQYKEAHEFSERELRLAHTIAGHVAFALDKQNADDVMEASEERFKALVRNSGDVIEITDEQGVCLYVSNSVTQVLGYDPQELIGTSGFGLIHPDDMAIAEGALTDVLSSARASVCVELRARHRSGDWIDIEATARNHLTNPNISGIVVNIREVGERKRAAEALRASEVRFRTLVQNATDITAILDADGTTRYASPSTAQVMGYEPEELIGRRVFDFMHPDDLAPVAQALVDATATETPVDLPPTAIELRMRHRDGSWRYLEAVGTNLLDDESIRGIVVNARDITDRKSIEALVVESEERFRDLFENANDMVYTRDLDGCITAVNKMGERLTGYTREELLGRPITDFIAGSDPQSSMMTIENSPPPDDDDESDIVEFMRKDGTTVMVEVRARLIWKDGEAVAVQGIARDISERLEAEGAVIASEERFRSLVQNALDVIAVLSVDGTITYITPSIERITGHDVAEMTGRNVSEFLHPEDLLQAQAHVAKSLEDAAYLPAMEMRFRHRDGGYRFLEGSGRNMLSDPAIAGFVINARDISERRHFEEELQRQAFYERLTGLPNRALFMDRLGHALAHRARTKDMLAVLFLDLDRFKLINDSLGHAVGDELLTAVAERLTKTLRPGDTVARFGGDEFTILLEGLGCREDATQVAQRIIDDLRAPFTLRGHEMFTSASIGVTFAGGGDSPGGDDLLRDADVALYRAKDDGRSRYVVFTEEMNLRAIERLDIANDLRRAVSSGHIRINYQPEVDLATGRLLGFEALARWKHPRFGEIAPSEFIRMAEDNGLIVNLGQSVLARACRQLRRWQTRVGPDMPLFMSVNFSARQIQQLDIVEEVAANLAANDLDPGSLVVELTESVAVGDDTVIADRLRSLRQLGVRVAIDDFGAGYTSLSYLTRVTADILKIDSSFIWGIETDAGKAAVVAALIKLAHGFGLSVTAEGIETQEQLAQLQAAGCDQGQGYLFSRPLAAQTAGRLLKTSFVLPK